MVLENQANPRFNAEEVEQLSAILFAGVIEELLFLCHKREELGHAVLLCVAAKLINRSIDRGFR